MTMRAGRSLAGLFCLAGGLLAQHPIYEGPAVLSRGWGPSLGTSGEVIRFRPFFGVNGSYDSGLAAVSVNEKGEIRSENSYGADANFGVFGYHPWKRTVVGVDYRGYLRHYSQNSYYDGFDNSLAFMVTHQVSRRVAFSLRESAGVYSRDFGGSTPYWLFDTSFAGVPANSLFDARTVYSHTMGDLTFQKSARLSFNMGADGGIVRRRPSALIGVNTARARGDMSYLLGRRLSLSLDYSFSHFEFTGLYGSSDVHAAGAGFSTRIGRYWEFAIRAGAHRVESKGLARVAVDPILAAIIGTTTGLQAYHRVNIIPGGDVRLSRVFRRSSLSFRYGRAADAGNGIYLTSQRESADVSYSYSGIRNWNVGFSGGYNSFSSLTFTAHKYEGYNVGGGVSRSLGRSMHLVTRVDWRHIETGSLTLRRRSVHVSAGFAFSPGDLPLSLW